MLGIKALRATTWGVAVLAIVPHIFTCVLPTVAAVLGTTGLLGTAWMHTPWGMVFQKYHFVLLMVATLAAVVSFASTIVRYRCGCGPNCACGPDCDCATAPRGGKGALVFSSVLLVLVGASWLASPFQHVHHMEMMGMPMGHDMLMEGMEHPMVPGTVPHDAVISVSPTAMQPEPEMTYDDAQKMAKPEEHPLGNMENMNHMGHE